MDLTTDKAIKSQVNAHINRLFDNFPSESPIVAVKVKKQKSQPKKPESDSDVLLSDHQPSPIVDADELLARQLQKYDNEGLQGRTRNIDTRKAPPKKAVKRKAKTEGDATVKRANKGIVPTKKD